MNIYRDDDINRFTCIEDFRRIHRIFQKHNKIHTVACEMKGLWDNKALFWMLATDSLINVELHGWEHYDYSSDLWDIDSVVTSLSGALTYWSSNAKRMLGVKELPELKRITTFFPPWNRTAPHVQAACDILRLKLSASELDCKWMFHWWSTTPEEVEEHLR